MRVDMRFFLTAALVGAFMPTASSAGVVINELLYHAPGDLDALQFVEVLNGGGSEADLSGWRFAKGISFTFPEGFRLAPGAATVVCSDARLFAEYYRFQPLGVFKGVLKKKGERLELVDAQGARVDQVSFGSEDPWPRSPDGFSSSLERLSSELSGELPGNWESSPLSADASRPSGSPGRPNHRTSTNLPPVLSNVELLSSVEPQTPGYRVRAQVEDSDGILSVRALYRVVTPGSLGPEKSLPMTMFNGSTYQALIPPQDQGQILRVRVEAIDTQGTRRVYPGENEPRPALSLLIRTPQIESTLPQISILHTRAEDLRRARRVRAGDGFRAGKGEADEESSRQRLERAFRSGLDPSYVWAHMALALKVDAKELAALQPLFVSELASRDQRVKEGFARVAGQGIEGVRAGIRLERARFADSLKAAMTEEPRSAFQKWWQSEGAELGISPRSQSTAAVLRRLWDLERVFAQVTLQSEMQIGRLAAFCEFFSEPFAQRDALRTVAASLLKEEDGQALIQEKVQPLTLETAVEFQRHFGVEMPSVKQEELPVARSSAASSVQGTSALIYHDPSTRRTQLFDFIQTVPRSSGWKAHLQKDRLLEGMSTLNLIFEYNERLVLAEPMAYELYQRAGMPAPRSGFVRLSIDDKPVGYHAMVEQPNKAFLRRNRIGDEGHLYKLLWYGQGLKGQHEKKTRIREGHGDLQAVVAAIAASADPEAQWAAIRKHFDVAEVINYFAVNLCLSHWDGFFNNYFAYHDVGGTGKWTLYPWDQDKTWGFHDGIQGEEEVFYDMPVTFGMNGDRQPGLLGFFLPKKSFGMGHVWWRPAGWFSGPLLANPTFRKHYRARVKQILETEYTPEKWEPEFRRLEESLRPEVAYRAELRGEDAVEAQRRLSKHVNALRQHLQKRRQFLQGEEAIQNAGPFDLKSF